MTKRAPIRHYKKAIIIFSNKTAIMCSRDKIKARYEYDRRWNNNPIDELKDKTAHARIQMNV